jgi:hypothetical protein
VPLFDRFFIKPDRDITAPTQCVVVLGQVCHLVFELGELVAAILVKFVGHWLLLMVDSARITPVGWYELRSISDLFNNAHAIGQIHSFDYSL